MSRAEFCLCPNILWKVELVSNATEYLAEEISEQSIEKAAWLLLNAYHKIWAERNNLKTELLIKKETELKILGKIQPIYIAKNEKACLEENTKNVTNWPYDKEISVGIKIKSYDHI